VLPRYLKTLLNQANEDGFDGNNFDLCILLGDLATVPDPHAYKFLVGYLTQDRYETPEGLGCPGLNLRPEQILAIPGNHDKLLRTNLDIFHAEFTTKLDIPKVNPGSWTFWQLSIGEQPFLFILVDASVYAQDELVIDVHCRDHLARGEVTPALRKEIIEALATVPNRENMVTIMLVHYAVDIKRLPRHKQWQESFLPHQCEGLDDLVSELRKKFQLGAVLHGHMHVPCLYNHDGAQVVSATTTLGQGGPNGFFVLKVLDTGEIRAEHHVWNGIRFAPDPDTSLNKSIALYPTRRELPAA
jgi:predicted phosphodiesterase